MNENTTVRPVSMTNYFAIVIGLYLLIDGIWGLFSPVTFGMFTTNLLHAGVHIVLGCVGIITGFTQGARKYCIFLGLIMLVVGLMRFVPGADQFIVNLFNENHALATFNIVGGILSLFIAFLARRLQYESVNTTNEVNTVNPTK